MASNVHWTRPDICQQPIKTIERCARILTHPRYAGKREINLVGAGFTSNSVLQLGRPELHAKTGG